MDRDEKGRFIPKTNKAALQRANAAYAERVSWSEPQPEAWVPETRNPIIETHKDPSVRAEIIALAVFIAFCWWCSRH